MSAEFLHNGISCVCDTNECVILPCCMKPPDLFSNYMQFNEIETYLKVLSQLYSSFVRLHVIGCSVEKVPIYAVVIDWCNDAHLNLNEHERMVLSVPQYIPITAHLPKQHRNRRTVLIEAGTHGCEWLSISTAICCIHQLIEENVTNREFLRKLRFVIVPLTNPDGYEISQKKRNWSQNARGVDCDQNYDVNWTNDCSCSKNNAYRGEFPFSEPETRALRNLLHVLGPQLLMVISLHAFDQSLMFPWGYKNGPIKGKDMLRFVAERGRDAIKQYSGRCYHVGSISKMFRRNINGLFVDYVYDTINVPFVYCMELPARTMGFQPCKGFIKDIVMESWAGISHMCATALFCMRQMAIRRFLRPYVRPNYIEHSSNFNDPLYEMDLTKLCHLVEYDTPVVTGEQKISKIFTCHKRMPWQCRMTSCKKGRKSQKGYTANKPISPTKRDFISQKSVPDTTKQCCESAARTFRHLPGFTDSKV